jgi:hypothetical protein
VQDIRTSRHHKPLPIFFPTVRAPVVPRIFHHRPFLKGTPIAPALSWTMCPWLAGGFRVSDRFGMSWNQKPDDNSLYYILHKNNVSWFPDSVKWIVNGYSGYKVGGVVLHSGQEQTMVLCSCVERTGPSIFLRYKMGHCVLCPQKIARIICLTFCRTSNSDDLLHPLVALVALVTLILFEVKKANSRRSWELQRLDRKAQCCSEAKPSSQTGARHSMLNNYFKIF